MQMMIQAHADHLAREVGALRRADAAVEIDPFEGDDQIGFGDQIENVLARLIERLDHMRRMIGREHGAVLQVRHHAGAERFGELHARIPFGLRARAAPVEQQRPLRRLQHGGRTIDVGLLRARRGRWLEAAHIRQSRHLVERLLLQAGVEHDIDRSAGLGAGGDIGLRHRIDDGLSRSR